MIAGKMEQILDLIKELSSEERKVLVERVGNINEMPSFELSSKDKIWRLLQDVLDRTQSKKLCWDTAMWGSVCTEVGSIVLRLTEAKTDEDVNWLGRSINPWVGIMTEKEEGCWETEWYSFAEWDETVGPRKKEGIELFKKLFKLARGQAEENKTKKIEEDKERKLSEAMREIKQIALK